MITQISSGVEAQSHMRWKNKVKRHFVMYLGVSFPGLLSALAFLVLHSMMPGLLLFLFLVLETLFTFDNRPFSRDVKKEFKPRLRPCWCSTFV